MLRVANSTPMVDLLSRENSLRVNLLSRLDLPTPESPISTTAGGAHRQISRAAPRFQERQGPAMHTVGPH